MPVDLDLIDRLDKAATAGPWACHAMKCYISIYSPVKGGHGRMTRTAFVPTEFPVQRERSDQDAAFIAAARTLLPQAAAEIKALREEVKRLQEMFCERTMCSCRKDCQRPCKGQCGCRQCANDYADFLNVE